MANSFFQDLISTPSNFIALLSSIGTLITAVIALRAIRETQRQRESSYRPEIYVAGAFAHVFSPDFTTDLCGIKFMQYKKYKPVDQFDVPPEVGYEFDTTKFQAPTHWMTTTMHNIGLGTAKMIEYNWDFSYEKSIVILNKLTINSSLKIENGIAIKDEGKSYFLFTNNWHWSIDDSHKDFVAQIDFLEHKNALTIQSSIHIPGDYLNILILYMFLKHNLLFEIRDRTFMHETFDDVPKLHLHMSYSDIQNKRYHKKFEMSFLFTHMAPDDTPAPGLLYVKKEKFGGLHAQVKEIID